MMITHIPNMPLSFMVLSTSLAEVANNPEPTNRRRGGPGSQPIGRREVGWDSGPAGAGLAALGLSSRR